MNNRSEGRHVFMVLSICLFLFSPLIIFLEPITVSETLYYKMGVWIIVTPKINFVLCGLAVLLLIIALTVIWLTNIRKISIIFAIFCTICSSILLYGASLSYVSLSGESLNFRQAFSQNQQKYLWTDVKSIKYFDDLENTDTVPFYVFSFRDGEELTIVQNGRLTLEIRTRIDHKIREANIQFNRIHEW